jgi:catechol 2,3-dioxygenase-like lactoylglutathione lyase family enzyme
MSIELNHTIVMATNREKSAEFLAGMLGLTVGPVYGPFLPIELANGITLLYAHSDEVQGQHYAFLVGDAEFDAAMARLTESGIAFYADPFHREPGEINHQHGGRGVYFDDPDGHSMELLTRA